MTDSAFWRELAATFLLVPGHEMIGVDLQYAIGSGGVWQWRFAGNPNEFMETTFKRLATDGAFEIAPVGTTDLFGAWLEAIRKEGINFHQREGPKGYVFGHIDRVFQASAILCGKLEARARQAAFDEKHRQAPSKRVPENTLLPDSLTVPLGGRQEPVNAIQDGEIERRRKLLAEYKAAAKNPSNKKIYEARNSGIHKPEFYGWRNGTLPAESATTISFERFLREKKPPIPRKPKG